MPIDIHGNIRRQSGSLDIALRNPATGQYEHLEEGPLFTYVSDLYNFLISPDASRNINGKSITKIHKIYDDNERYTVQDDNPVCRVVLHRYKNKSNDRSARNPSDRVSLILSHHTYSSSSEETYNQESFTA